MSVDFLGWMGSVAGSSGWISKAPASGRYTEWISFLDAGVVNSCAMIELDFFDGFEGASGGFWFDIAIASGLTAQQQEAAEQKHRREHA